MPRIADHTFHLQSPDELSPATKAAVARANAKEHRTPEHASWCRHLFDLRALDPSHERCRRTPEATAADRPSSTADIADLRSPPSWRE